MAKKLKDLVVKTGEYEHNGETKGRYKTVGAIMENDDGGKFIMLDRTFNPAGVPNPQNRDTVIVSMFDPRDKDGNATGGGDGEAPPAKKKAAGGGKGRAPAGGADDEIPF